MGLPCVRKLQDRIMELEQIGGGGTGGSGGETVPRTTNSREDEIAQLQSAIVDLNRYIHALESKVDMNAVASAGARGGNGNRPDEESVKLEIHENDEEEEKEDEGQDVPCVVSSTHKNVIITSEAIEEDSEEEEEKSEADAEAEEEKSEAEAEEEEAEE